MELSQSPIVSTHSALPSVLFNAHPLSETQLRPGIGHFSSLPWIPFYQGSEGWPVELKNCGYEEVPQLLEKNQVALTPISTAQWFEAEPHWKRLGRFGIGLRGKAGNILLFTNTPIQKLQNCPIAVKPETSNSRKVLHAVLAQKYGLEMAPWVEGVNEQDTAIPRLLTQKDALEEQSKNRFKYTYDIGYEWWSWQGTPIVSAVWVYNSNLDSEIVGSLRTLLENSLELYGQDPRASIVAYQKKYGLNLSVSSIQSLLGNFEYLLDEEAEKGIDRLRRVLPQSVEIASV